jgi:hypothetical protein
LPELTGWISLFGPSGTARKLAGGLEDVAYDVTFASTQATKVALQAGAIDVIVSDRFWVSRQRAS